MPEIRHPLPPRLLPVLYFAFAYGSLILALAVVAMNPRAVTGFFYHARMVAVVHLITLGWISCSILGAIYIVGPLALRMPLAARRLDYIAYACTTIGIAGMASHFYIEEFSGMAWSAIMVVGGFAGVAWRVAGALGHAPLPAAVKTHIALAFLNVLVAGTFGILLGFDKVHQFLPGFVLTNVYAHAHLAAVGWAAMMVVGVGYRLLPMVLPAAMPEGRSLYASAALLEAGAVTLFVSLLARSVWVPIGALLVAAGFGVFLAHVGWMRRHRRPSPVALKRPDYTVGHAMAALTALVLCVVLGSWFALAPMSDVTLRAALAYGVLGLLGFLGQMVLGMESRILPTFAWYWAFANSGFRGPVTSPHDMRVRAFERGTFWLWTCGVPILAGGFFLDAVPLVAAGAVALLAAVVLAALNAGAILRHAFGRAA